MSGMREIGAKLGLSVATVSRGLRKHPSVKKETQQRIEVTATEMGYTWNPHVGELMSSIRRSRTASFQGTIATLWAGARSSEKADARVELIRRGVLMGLEEHGLRADEFWIDEHTPSALARILFNRGIEGTLLCGPAFFPASKFKAFPFEKFSTVCVGWGLSELNTHSVRFDYFQGMRMALKKTGPMFGKKIAAIWSGSTDARANGMAKAGFGVHHPGGMASAEKLFFDAETMNVTQTVTALKRNKIEALLIGSGIMIPPAIAEIIPRKNWTLFQVPADGPVFGWIDTQNTLMGAWGLDMLVAKLLRRQRGLAEFAQVLLVPPVWRHGQSGARGSYQKPVVFDHDLTFAY